VSVPLDRFWLRPRQLRQEVVRRGWTTVAAFHTRNVPHAGHEWMMKGAWLAASAASPCAPEWGASLARNNDGNAAGNRLRGDRV
jgi:hypothetical protein